MTFLQFVSENKPFCLTVLIVLCVSAILVVGCLCDRKKSVVFSVADDSEHED